MGFGDLIGCNLFIVVVMFALPTHASEADQTTIIPNASVTPTVLGADEAKDPAVDIVIPTKSLPSGVQMFSASGAQPESLPATTDAEKRLLRLTIPVHRLQQLLEGHGRSLWLIAGAPEKDATPSADLSHKLRVDLPAVNLGNETKVTRGKSGVQLKLQAVNLLPGYRVFYSEYLNDDHPLPPRQVSVGGKLPHLLAASPSATGVQQEIVIQWSALPPAENKSATPVDSQGPAPDTQPPSNPPAAIAASGQVAAPAEATAKRWLLYIENVDGSRSRTLHLNWANGRFTSIKEFQESVAAPIDEPVIVPNVEGMPLDRAAIVLSKAGASPVPVSPDSLLPLPSPLLTPDWLSRQIASRQGVLPGEKVLRGQRVLLTVRGDENEIMSAVRNTWLPAAPRGGLAGSAGRTPNGQLQSVGLRDDTTGGSLGGEAAPGSAKPVPIQEPINATGGLEGSADKGGVAKTSGGLRDDSANPKRPIDSRPTAAAADQTNKAAPAEGGLVNSADRFAKEKQQGGLIDESPEPVAQPGIDVAQNDSPENTNTQPNRIPVGSGDPEPNGSNEDVVKLPLIRIKIPDLKGNTSTEAVENLKPLQLELTTGDKSAARDIVVAQNPAPGWQEPIKAVDVKFEVPVPQVVGQRYQTAQAMLNDFDLRSDVDTAGHEHHGCIGQSPPAHTQQQPSTLPHGGVVKLKLGVPVPDVRHLTLTQAASRLEAEGLKSNSDDKMLPSDTVTNQTPPPHSKQHRNVVPLGTIVALELGRKVPNVEHLALDAAKNTLADAGLQAIVDQRAGPTAIVMHQKPRPGALVAVPSKVELDLRVTVPDVRGQTLSEAQARLQRAGFIGKVVNTLAQSSDIVRGQQPGGGDTSAVVGAVVELSPVMAQVPDVVGKTLDEAYRQLHDEGLFAVDYDKKLARTDVVTRQKPEPNTELERGANVHLDAFVEVPKVLALDAATAERLIVDSALRPVYDVRPLEGDFVATQDPRAGASVRPRTAISIQFGTRAPRLVGLSEREADAILQATGIHGQIARTIPIETDDETKRDVVIVRQQQPPPGQTVIRTTARGAMMQLACERFVYVPSIPVGHYVGKSIEEVHIELRNAGLEGRIVSTRVEMVEDASRWGRNSKVIEEQSIPAGEMVRPGTQILMTAVQYQQYQTNIRGHVPSTSQPVKSSHYDWRHPYPPGPSREPPVGRDQRGGGFF